VLRALSLRSIRTRTTQFIDDDIKCWLAPCTAVCDRDPACSGPAHALLYLKAGRSTHADWVDSRVADPTEPTGKWKAPRSASKACTAGES
jgi:hypothetical protein